MNISLKYCAVLICLAVPMLTACDSFSGKKDYAYFRQHVDEAKSVSDECQLNGTSGMDQKKIAECDAARQAYSNRNYTY